MNKNGEIVLYLLTINNAYGFFKFSINLRACLRCHFLVDTSSNLFHLYRAAIQIHVIGYRKHQREIFILIFLHWLSRFIHNTNIEIRYQIYLFCNGTCISTFFRDVKFCQSLYICRVNRGNLLTTDWHLSRRCVKNLILIMLF